MEHEYDWRNGLSADQTRAAEHIGLHARLLAGPGTGKTRTLTRRVLGLVIGQGVDPSEILVLTFTRVAAFQFREELQTVLEPLGLELPRVSTLHSFALRQLLRNSDRTDVLPDPLRVADDWEERYIIEEDLKQVLEKKDVREVRELLQKLSADWETLKHEEDDWGKDFPDPKFLGAWRNHRRVFGYTLRSELVYQLKRALNQYPAFRLECSYCHLLVDEYQDLNHCDLAVIKELVERGMELFAAGDDDQSIYGFRHADPTGIRRFASSYPRAIELELETCFRCDRSILRLAEFVADLDLERLPKPTRPRDDAGEGEVHLWCYPNQYDEAQGVAGICKELMESDSKSVRPSEILVLMRSDHQGKISKPICEALSSVAVPVAERVEGNPLEIGEGRLFFATMRLLDDPSDSLAWRTVLQLESNAIGPKAFDSVYRFAHERDIPFVDALQIITDNPDALPVFGMRISDQVRCIEEKLSRLRDEDIPLIELMEKVSTEVISDSSVREEIVDYFTTLINETETGALSDLLRAHSVSLGGAEQELESGAVNVLTMHKAKGLTADTVIIVGAEDEFIPGRNTGAKEGDERRLLYVSMTRARHRLFITYCQKRVGDQKYTGRRSGEEDRTLTTFLRDAPITVENRI